MPAGPLRGLGEAGQCVIPAVGEEAGRVWGEDALGRKAWNRISATPGISQACPSPLGPGAHPTFLSQRKQEGAGSPGLEDHFLLWPTFEALLCALYNPPPLSPFSPCLSAEAAFSASARLKDRKWTWEVLVSFKVSAGLDTMLRASALPMAPSPSSLN